MATKCTGSKEEMLSATLIDKIFCPEFIISARILFGFFDGVLLAWPGVCVCHDLSFSPFDISSPGAPGIY